MRRDYDVAEDAVMLLLVGFINFSNEMDLNIIIRTLIIKGNKGYIQVGGGIVSDSKPKTEYDETISKAKALFEACKWF